MSRNIYHIQIAGKIGSVKTIVYKKYLKQIEFALLIEVSIINAKDEHRTDILEGRCIADHGLLNTIEYYKKVNCKVVIKGIYVKAYTVF